MIQNLSACSPDTINSLSSCQEEIVSSSAIPLLWGWDYLWTSDLTWDSENLTCPVSIYEGEWSQQGEVWEGIEINWGEWLFNLGGEACG